MLINPNVKGGRSFFLTFLSFKINGLAKKFINMLTKKPFKINDLAAGGPGPPKLKRGARVKILTTAFSRRQKNDSPILQGLFLSLKIPYHQQRC